jgi:hypothetical protein
VHAWNGLYRGNQRLADGHNNPGHGHLRSNAPPGGCGCINMNGGSASFAWMPGRFGLVGDVTFDTESNISTSQ